MAVDDNMLQETMHIQKQIENQICENTQVQIIRQNKILSAPLSSSASQPLSSRNFGIESTYLPESSRKNNEFSSNHTSKIRLGNKKVSKTVLDKFAVKQENLSSPNRLSRGHTLMEGSNMDL